MLVTNKIDYIVGWLYGGFEIKKQKAL